ncbi:hypothetical protein CMUS01_15618, partial [Colletotrichum musicola]
HDVQPTVEDCFSRFANDDVAQGSTSADADGSFDDHFVYNFIENVVHDIVHVDSDASRWCDPDTHQYAGDRSVRRDANISNPRVGNSDPPNIEPSENLDIFEGARRFGNGVRMARRVVSPGTIKAADILIKRAREGAHTILDDDPVVIARVRRHIGTVLRGLQQYIATRVWKTRGPETTTPNGPRAGTTPKASDQLCWCRGPELLQSVWWRHPRAIDRLSQLANRPGAAEELGKLLDEMKQRWWTLSLLEIEEDDTEDRIILCFPAGFRSLVAEYNWPDLATKFDDDMARLEEAVPGDRNEATRALLRPCTADTRRFSFSVDERLAGRWIPLTGWIVRARGGMSDNSGEVPEPNPKRVPSPRQSLPCSSSAAAVVRHRVVIARDSEDGLPEDLQRDLAAQIAFTEGG